MLFLQESCEVLNLSLLEDVGDITFSGILNEPTPTSSKGHLEKLITSHQDTQLDETDLRSFLASTNEGKSLLLQYEANGLLDNAGRRQLCNIILNRELCENPDAKITSQRFYQLAYNITRVFKKESAPAYFTPYVCVSPTQKHAAKGKLLDSYRHRRRQFCKTGLITARKRSASTNSPYCSTPGSPHSILEEATNKLPELTEDIEDTTETYMLWLKNACDPWHTVELYWEDTRKARLKKFADSQMSIADYFREFKALGQPGGLHLVGIVFIYL